MKKTGHAVRQKIVGNCHKKYHHLCNAHNEIEDDKFSTCLWLIYP